jgi:hypothetical protein
VQDDQARYARQLQRLMSETGESKGAAAQAPVRIHDGLMLGLFDPDGDAAAKYSGEASPFSGRPYGENSIFATTDAKDVSEAIRGLLDNHHLGGYTIASDYGKKLVARLQGAHFERLTAHSNGATIAEALIRRGTITVDELNVVGGDRSLINRVGFQELIQSGRVKRVVVWINPGDIIPPGSSSTLISPFGPTGSLPLAAASSYVAQRLLGMNAGGDARVEYRILDGAEYTGQAMRLDPTFFDAHSLKDAYLVNMRRYFQRR